MEWVCREACQEVCPEECLAVEPGARVPPSRKLTNWQFCSQKIGLSWVMLFTFCLRVKPGLAIWVVSCYVTNRWLRVIGEKKLIIGLVRNHRKWESMQGLFMFCFVGYAVLILDVSLTFPPISRGTWPFLSRFRRYAGFCSFFVCNEKDACMLTRVLCFHCHPGRCWIASWVR